MTTWYFLIGTSLVDIIIMIVYTSIMNKEKKTVKKIKRKKGESVILQEELWELCKEYVRKNYPNECYTCRATGLFGKNWQTGHYLPKKALAAYLKYDPRVLRPQCMFCNIHCGGSGADYHIRLVEDNGQEFVSGIHRDRSIKMTPKENIAHFKRMIEWYRENI